VEFPAAAQGGRLIIIAAADRYRNRPAAIRVSTRSTAESVSPLNRIYIYGVVTAARLKSFPHLLRYDGTTDRRA